ncbi:MAG: hypothetical protein IPM71_16465 [Bacteroidota bacterium]|nr:MAG: hypothetical protein IPM71_16465 [Bacteroidota bacterium]
MPNTIQDRIKTVMGGGGHVVILGAGASIASTFRNSEATGKKLPSMDNFIDIVGLTDIVQKLPKNLVAQNFEELYSKLHKDNSKSNEILEIEKRVYDYFKDMELPNEPTIYDHLVLALRPKDLIATFNWDPFLYQAFVRNNHVADMPYFAYLHGTVALGYSKEDKRSGPAGWYSKETKNYFEPTRLLYPVDQKNYNQDEFISKEWDRLKYWLNSDSTKRVTIFGYGAPKSDLEAVGMLNESWGTRDKRNMEQFEIVDIREEETVRQNWDNFIHSHHYDYSSDYFSSSLASNPRRTSESYFQHYMPMTPSEAFSENNPVPTNFKTLEELWEWYKPLVEAEKEWNEKNKE